MKAYKVKIIFDYEDTESYVESLVFVVRAKDTQDAKNRVISGLGCKLYERVKNIIVKPYEK